MPGSNDSELTTRPDRPESIEITKPPTRRLFDMVEKFYPFNDAASEFRRLLETVITETTREDQLLSPLLANIQIPAGLDIIYQAPSLRFPFGPVIWPLGRRLEEYNTDTDRVKPKHIAVGENGIIELVSDMEDTHANMCLSACGLASIDAHPTIHDLITDYQGNIVYWVDLPRWGAEYEGITVHSRIPPRIEIYSFPPDQNLPSGLRNHLCLIGKIEFLQYRQVSVGSQQILALLFGNSSPTSIQPAREISYIQTYSAKTTRNVLLSGAMHSIEATISVKISSNGEKVFSTGPLTFKPIVSTSSPKFYATFTIRDRGVEYQYNYVSPHQQTSISPK